KANWLDEFRTELTRDEKFTLSSEKDVITPMMHNTDYYGYTETDNIQVLEMDYKGNEISMIVILPKVNDIKKLEVTLDLKKLNCWRDSLRTKRVKVSLPKFKFETKYFMSEDLQELGMKTAFEYPQADFTGISPTGELFISEVVHQTFVEVAEYGTEAAAATAVVMEAGAAMPTEEPKIFKADHPFIFIIQQKNTRNILFMGKLYDPTK
ncbi:MAG: serpin family protein, partial [Candidatus Cloacimonetes bacterium]|nr:serpin family protein [Candidatus Cloacimonadota bacterium]